MNGRQEVPTQNHDEPDFYDFWWLFVIFIDFWWFFEIPGSEFLMIFIKSHPSESSM